VTDWSDDSLLLTVVTTTSAVGLGVLMIARLALTIHHRVSSAFQKLTLDLGLSPQSHRSINGASKISGTTFVLRLEAPGSTNSVAFAIRLSTRTSVYAVLGAAIWLHLTCQVRQIASRPRRSKPSSK